MNAAGSIARTTSSAVSISKPARSNRRRATDARIITEVPPERVEAPTALPEGGKPAAATADAEHDELRK